MTRITPCSAAVLAVALCVACGGSPAAETTEPPAPVPTTGGELPPPDEPDEPPIVRTTTPVPVPLPPTPREQLSEPLQLLWDRTERAIEVRPPEPPSEGTFEAVEAWAAGPFVEWLQARRAAVAEAEDDVAFLGEAAPPERAVAATLFGYMYEDTAAGMRGSPVPEAVAADPDLLAAYVEALDEALLPYAQSAAEAYATCATTLDRHGDPGWVEWFQYCADRGRELIEVYELAAEPPEDPAEAPEDV